MITLTGLDILVRDNFTPLHGQRVAVLAHAASVDSSLQHIVDLLSSHPKVTLELILSPEHGLRGAAQDMVKVDSALDPITALPVISLYGSTPESLAPKAEVFKDIDALIIDLADVGSRYYTYAQTMALCMKTAGECGVKVIVLDRPNPINGEDIEGCGLSASCRSFCGFTPVAQRHGLTIGELARVYESGFGEGADAYPAIKCDLIVVPLENWKRGHYYDQTGLPWVLPSPNMPALDTAIVYPGMCLFEATNLSEGRGTTRPFEFAGAPFVNGKRWAAEALKESLELEGAVLRPMTFVPQFHKWAGQTCGGIQIHVTDRGAFKPLRWGLALIAAAKRLYPKQFEWRKAPYEFVGGVPAIDLLYGNSLFRSVVDSGSDLIPVADELKAFESDYRFKTASALLY